jgi:hypothetical protein
MVQWRILLGQLESSGDSLSSAIYRYTRLQIIPADAASITRVNTHVPEAWRHALIVRVCKIVALVYVSISKRSIIFF